MEDSKIRVVFLIGEMGKGGSERQLYLILKHMDKSLVDPCVVVFNRSPNTVYNDELRTMGVHVAEIPPKVTGILRRIKYLYLLIKSIKPHIIHSWSVHDNPYAGLIGLLAGVPIRLGSMRDSLSNKNFNDLSGFLQCVSLHSVKYIFVNSIPIINELEQRGYPRERVIYLRNCVELVEEDRSKLPGLLPVINSTESKIIGTVSNIRRKKNIHVFIKGLAGIISEDPTVFGLIAGQPIAGEMDYYHEIQDQISGLGLSDRIFLLGFQDNIPQLMYHFSVFCLLSSYEGTPNVVLEAMAAACPVIASRTGGISDIITHKANGILVEAGNVIDFQKNLRQLLSAPGYAHQLGQAGQAFVKAEYSCATICRQLFDRYLDFIERS